MKNAKILIAEDNELSRANLSELLESYGYEVTAVEMVDRHGMLY